MNKSRITRLKTRKAVIFPVVFVLIGLMYLLFASAATSSVAIEPELGVISSNASIRSGDNKASGGSSVLFHQHTPSGGGVPNISQVGPRGTLTNSTCGQLAPGTYRSLNCTGKIYLQSSGDYSFIDVKSPGFGSQGGGANFPRSGTVTLDHVETSGLWFEDSNGQGGQVGWTIKWSKLYGGAFQALRPKGVGKIFVSDTWLLSDGPPPDGAHTEVLQHIYRADGKYERVAFSRQPVSNNTVTAVLTMENANNDGGDTQFIDCEIGYWNGSSWSKGGGVYQVYPGLSQWVRPRFHTSASDAWYNHIPPNSLVDPVYL